MKTKAVHWSEGMLVLPQHFQAEHAHIMDCLSSAVDWRLPYNYGIHRIDLNEEALRNFEARVSKLQLRMRDGTLVSAPENARLATLDLRSAFQEASELYLFVALPEMDPATGTGAFERTVVSTSNWEDVDDPGNPQGIESAQLKVELVAQPGLDPPNGYESLPIARLVRSTASDAIPELDSGYIPPLCSAGCWDSFREEILAVITARLGAFSKQQSSYLQTAGGWSEANQPHIRRRIMKLFAVNLAYPTLWQFLQTPDVHPFAWYTELCRAVGSLSMFRDDWGVPDLPAYDHDDLGRIFRRLLQELKQLLEEEVQFVSRYEFVGVNTWLEVALDPQWLQGQHDLFVAVQSDMSARKVDVLVTRQFLDWKLGSNRTIDQIFRGGQEGVHLRRISGVHPILPALHDMHYFQIAQSGPYWEDVADRRVLALMVNNRFVSGSFEGRNTITIRDSEDHRRDLSFYLYVVQKTAS